MSEAQLLQGRAGAVRWPAFGNVANRGRMRVSALSPPSALESGHFEQFLSMREVFRGTGGLATGDEVAQRLSICSDQPVSRMARWIVERQVVNFRWQSQVLVPLFQFDLADMSLHDDVCAAVHELAGVFDDWEIACWFARPNGWLHGAVPAQRATSEPAAVLDAARADRFVARG